MSERDYSVLKFISKEMHNASQFLDGVTLEYFLNDEVKKRAVAMTLVYIGTVINRLSNDLRDENPTIPWKNLADFGNSIADSFRTSNMEDVWKISKNEFPQYKIYIDEILLKPQI
jgi:uncharacterized protein with HEPN domain